MDVMYCNNTLTLLTEKLDRSLQDGYLLQLTINAHVSSSLNFIAMNGIHLLVIVLCSVNISMFTFQ